MNKSNDSLHAGNWLFTPKHAEGFYRFQHNPKNSCIINEKIFVVYVK